MGFGYEKRGRQRIISERPEIIAWRERYLRRIREIREADPERAIVYADETWLNQGHRTKKEWVDLPGGELAYDEYMGVCHELGSYFQEKIPKRVCQYFRKIPERAIISVGNSR